MNTCAWFCWCAEPGLWGPAYYWDLGQGGLLGHENVRACTNLKCERTICRWWPPDGSVSCQLKYSKSLWIFSLWTRSKENCSSDAISVYVCESNKEFWENTIAREFIIEWVINTATASLRLLNTSGSVAMDRYQWLSNTFAWHYMLAFTASHTWNA